MRRPTELERQGAKPPAVKSATFFTFMIYSSFESYVTHYFIDFINICTSCLSNIKIIKVILLSLLNKKRKNMNHKLKNNNSPFFRWLILCISLLIPFLLISWKYIKGALSADASGITYIIFFVFLYGFISSIWISIYIAKESRELKKISDIRNIDQEKGGVHKLFSQSLEAQSRRALKLISKYF